MGSCISQPSPKTDPMIGCPFCHVVGVQAERVARLPVPENNPDELVAFWDIAPAAKAHILVCPREHIKDIAALERKDIPMIKKMVSYGRALLEEQGFAKDEDMRIGFHRPPFTSVPHLHLHCIGLPYRSSVVKIKYSVGSHWWWDATELVDHLSLNE